MRFIVDAQLPPALARMLVELGQHAVLITKDENFAHRFHQSSRTPVVVWLRVGNISRQGLLNWFSPLLPKIIKLVEEENRLIELL